MVGSHQWFGHASDGQVGKSLPGSEGGDAEYVTACLVYSDVDQSHGSTKGGALWARLQPNVLKKQDHQGLVQRNTYSRIQLGGDVRSSGHKDGAGRTPDRLEAEVCSTISIWSA